MEPNEELYIPEVERVGLGVSNTDVLMTRHHGKKNIIQ